MSSEARAATAILRPSGDVARGYVMVDVSGPDGWRVVVLTERARALLSALVRARHVRGAEVAIVRRLARSGLATLTDDGVGPLDHGRVDGERWTAERTELGRLVAEAKT